MEKQWKQWLTLFFWAPKSLQMVIVAMKLIDAPWKESCDQPRQHIQKQRHYFANKGLSRQGYGFSCGHVCIFHRARTNNFTICMEIQKTSTSQSNLEKEEWNWRNQPDCPAMQETWVLPLGWEDPLEEGMAIHSSILA